MPDENNVVADSSPATLVAPTEPAARAEWQRTGKLPDPKPARSPIGEPPARSTEPPTEPTGAVPVHSQETGGKKTAEVRLQELLADLKTSGLSPSELKTFRRQQTAAAPPAEAPKPEQTVNPVDPRMPKRPVPGEYKTWEELEAAKDKYHEDLAAYRAEKAVEDYRAELKQEGVKRELQAQLTKARERYGKDLGAEIAATSMSIFQDAQIPAAVKQMINDSPIFVDLVYTLGSKAEEMAEFVALAKSDPGKAIRKLVLMEHLVSEELSKGGGGSTAGTPPAAGAAERDASGKFAAAKPEIDKGSKAPPPPREVSGHSAPPGDASERAYKANDFAAFRAAENARDIARLKGR